MTKIEERRYAAKSVTEWELPADGSSEEPSTVTARAVHDTEDGTIFIEFRVGDGEVAYIRPNRAHEFAAQVAAMAFMFRSCHWDIDEGRCTGCMSHRKKDRRHGDARLLRHLELRDRGLAIPEIARKTGWSTTTVAKDLRAGAMLEDER